MLGILSYRHWAISQEFFNQYGLLVFKLLSEGKSLDQLIKKYSEEDLAARYQALAFEAGSVISTSRDSETGLWIAQTKSAQNVALIPVIGGLTKRGDLCSYGMRDYIGMIDKANKSSKIAGIVLDTESPGGTVDGTNEFGMAVKNSKKPVVAFGDGMVASAAYWVASQADEIIANKNNPTEFGSIGVLCVQENWQAYIQKEIGSVEILRARQSVDKARVNAIEPITDEQRKEITDELTGIAKEFISTVKAGRGDRLNTGEENIFTGKMYPAKKSKEMGMIDSLGNFQDAINRVGELAISKSSGGKSSASISTSVTSKSQVNTMKFNSKLLSAIFGKSENAEKTEPTAEEQKASMDAADKKVAEMEAENDRLKAESEEHAKKIGALEKTVSEQKAQVDTLTGEKAKLETANAELTTKLEAAPAGAKTSVVSKDDEGEGKLGKTSADKEMAEYKKAMNDNFLN
jgi:protease-4